MVVTSNYKIFRIIAILLGCIVIIWLIYDFVNSYKSTNKNYVHANQSFIKKDYIVALNLYKKVSELEPENLYAIEGQARSLMRMKRYKESEEAFKLALKKNDSFVPALTNIAILYDTIGDYDQAIIFYRKALLQDNKISKRMSWLKRFIKNIQFKPSTIEERLFYLEEQIELDDSKKRLKNKDLDKIQPDYEM